MCERSIMAEVDSEEIRLHKIRKVEYDVSGRL
jgi:hypothetical protein